MQLYKYLSILLGAGILFTLASCDNVDENNRYVVVPKPIAQKRVLIMEFTGNRCTNCPQGAAAIHSIQEDYPGDVIAVGLHPEGGGPNTMPYGNQDFRCEEAQVMYEYYLPGGFPCAVFNGDKNSMTTAYSTWGRDVYQIIDGQGPATMGIYGETHFNSSTRELTVDYTIDIYSNIATDLSVMVWIMENNIIGYQLDGGTLLNNYVHNHVLRASMNGPWGQPLPSLQLVEGSEITGKASLVLDDKWVAENCQVIIYTFQTGNRIVEQASVVDINE